jgi:hypothetical protein
MVYRYNFFLLGSAAGISPVVAGIKHSFGLGLSPIDIAEFLDRPSSIHKQVPKRMGGTWLGAIAVRTF